MESKANYAAIGAFVLVMLIAGLGFFYWLTGAGQNAAQADIRVVFTGPVTGLTTGSAVTFNGIKVGEVAELNLDQDDPNTVVARVRVDRNKPIRTDTRAVLSYQGLTGVANLQLEGGSRNAPMLLDAVEDEGMPTIHADISPFQDILESARNVLTRADSAMAAIDEFVTENGPAFNRTVNNVETFSRALADNADGVDDVLSNVSAAAASLTDISQSLQGSAARAQEILEAVDPGRVEALVANLTQSSESLTRVLDRTGAVVEGIDPKVVNDAVSNVAAAADTLNRTIAQANQVLAELQPADIDQLVSSLRQTSEDIGSTARRANEVMAAVDAEKVRGIVDQVDTAARGLAAATSNVTGVVQSAQKTLNQVNGVVGAVDPATVSGVVTDVSESAKTLRATVDQARAVVASVKPEDVDAAVASIRRAADEASAAVQRADALIAAVDVAKVRGIVDQVSGAAGGLASVIDSARLTLDRASTVVAAVDPAKVGAAVDDVAAFTAMLRDSRPQVDAILADVRSASASLRGLGETIDNRRGDVDTILTEARALSEQLNVIAARADGVLQKVDQYVEGDGEGLIAEATATLQSIRTVADTLRQQVGPITSNVARFTDRGLDSYARLADEGRRALARLDRVLSGIERDPQQFIFGGTGVPEYSPRRR